LLADLAAVRSGCPIEGSAMASIGTATFTSPHEYEASFRLAKLRLVFAHGGEFRARLTSVVLPNLQLLSAEESLPRIAHIELKSGSVFIAFPMSFDECFSWGGAPLKPGDLTFHSRDGRVHQRTGGVFRWAVMSLSPEHLGKFTSALAGTDTPIGSAESAIFRPERRSIRALQRLHAKACQLAKTNPEFIAKREVARAIEQEILHALANCLESADAVLPDDRAWQRRSTIMSRLEDVLERHQDHPLGMAELCRAVGVSARTLSACCRATVGMTPRQYDRLKRLNLVRAALHESASSRRSFANLAGRYGFARTDLFSEFYRSVFGELPNSNGRYAE